MLDGDSLGPAVGVDDTILMAVCLLDLGKDPMLFDNYHIHLGSASFLW